MKLVLVALVICLLQSCVTARVGLYHQFRGTAEGGDGLVLIEVDKKISNRFGCKYVHKSYLTSGQPFNTRYEDTFDSLGCYLEIK